MPGPEDRDTDLWERNAGWWQEGFTDGADAEYEEQILPLARGCLAGAQRVLDVGTGEGQIARLVASDGGALVVGVDPTAAQLPPRTSAAVGSRTPVPTPTHSRSPTTRSTRSSSASCSSTSLRTSPRSPRSLGCSSRAVGSRSS